VVAPVKYAKLPKGAKGVFANPHGSVKYAKGAYIRKLAYFDA